MASKKMPDPRAAGPPDQRGFFERALRRAEVCNSDRVRFKDRGTDELEWRAKELALADANTQTLRTLLIEPALALVEDEGPAHHGGLRPNPAGLKTGYDPYDSGKLNEGQRARRPNLRKLSEWIQICNQVGKGGGDTE